MNLSMMLGITGLVCLIIAAVGLRKHLGVRPGLRLIVGGLLFACGVGVVICLVPSTPSGRALALLMLAGMAVVVKGIHWEKRRIEQERGSSKIKA